MKLKSTGVLLKIMMMK